MECIIARYSGNKPETLIVLGVYINGIHSFIECAKRARVIRVRAVFSNRRLLTLHSTFVSRRLNG